MHHQIPPAAVHRRHAAPADPELPAALRARRNRQPEQAIERRHFDTRPEHRLVNSHGKLEMEIVPFAPEQRMRGDPHQHIQVTGPATLPAGMSLLGNAQPRAVSRPGRHRH